VSARTSIARLGSPTYEGTDTHGHKCGPEGGRGRWVGGEETREEDLEDWNGRCHSQEEGEGCRGRRGGEKVAYEAGAAEDQAIVVEKEGSGLLEKEGTEGGFHRSEHLDKF